MVTPVIKNVNELNDELLNFIKKELEIDKKSSISWLILDNKGNAVAGTNKNIFHRQLPNTLLSNMENIIGNAVKEFTPNGRDGGIGGVSIRIIWK